MLTSKSYLEALNLLCEASENFQCLRSNLEALSTEIDSEFSKVTLGDIQSAANSLTATIAKITNLCASEVSDSTAEASE